MSELRNWAGNHVFSATTLHQPTTIDELCEVVARPLHIHVIGAGHSFNGIADGREMVTTERIELPIVIDMDRKSVSVSAATPYGILARELERAGMALHNMASLPHISVGGAVATATHGSGDSLGNLATAVNAVELVTSDGTLVHLSRGEPDFDGVVVGLGALGIVTRLSLDIQPTYQMRQVVYEYLDWQRLFIEFDNVMASADSVSLFTSFGDVVEEVWQKTRLGAATVEPVPDEFHGARLASRALHPVPSLPADNCTQQLGVPGSWADRLPHFRLDAVPASGNEIQAEYLVPRSRAIEALQAVLAIAPMFRDALQTSEIRSVAADNLWMSTAYHRDTICIHFSFKFQPAAIEAFLPHIESALEPFEPRPHWGKLFNATAVELEKRYEQMVEFRQLAERMDPRHAFRNRYLNRHVFDETNS